MNDIMLNAEDNKPQGISHLFNINQLELQKIINNFYENNHHIQLLDFIHYLDIPSNILKTAEIDKDQAADNEKIYHKIFERILSLSRTLEKNLTSVRINPNTIFSKKPALFMGVGCGNKMLCQGLPFDVLSMILTGEKLRRELQLNKCQILIANNHNCYDIAKMKAINSIAKAKKELLQIVVEKLGFARHWQIFLQTDIKNIIGEERILKYDEMLRKGTETALVGGEYYATELADIWALAGQDYGGIKLGWFMHNLDRKNTAYIMDEQPFHLRYMLFMALQNMKNTVTFAYVKAGAKLYPGLGGMLEKESPYICYYPYNRLLLSPFEKIIPKIQLATESKGGMQFKYYRKLISSIANLFEELVLGKNQLGRINRIPTSAQNKFRGYQLAEKANFIHNYIFSDIPEAYKIWTLGFPHTSKDL